MDLCTFVFVYDIRIYLRQTQTALLLQYPPLYLRWMQWIAQTVCCTLSILNRSQVARLWRMWESLVVEAAAASSPARVLGSSSAGAASCTCSCTGCELVKDRRNRKPKIARNFMLLVVGSGWDLSELIMDVSFWPSFIAHCEKSLLGGEFIIVLGCQISQKWHVGTICFSYMHRKWNQLIKHWLDQQQAMCALFGFCLTDEIICSI